MDPLYLASIFGNGNMSLNQSASMDYLYSLNKNDPSYLAYIAYMYGLYGNRSSGEDMRLNMSYLSGDNIDWMGLGGSDINVDTFIRDSGKTGSRKSNINIDSDASHTSSISLEQQSTAQGAGTAGFELFGLNFGSELATDSTVEQDHGSSELQILGSDTSLHKKTGGKFNMTLNGDSSQGLVIGIGAGGGADGQSQSQMSVASDQNIVIGNGNYVLDLSSEGSAVSQQNINIMQGEGNVGLVGGNYNLSLGLGLGNQTNINNIGLDYGIQGSSSSTGGIALGGMGGIMGGISGGEGGSSGSLTSVVSQSGGVSSQDGVQTGVLVDGGYAALGGGSGSISVVGGQIDGGGSIQGGNYNLSLGLGLGNQTNINNIGLDYGIQGSSSSTGGIALGGMGGIMGGISGGEGGSSGSLTSVVSQSGNNNQMGITIGGGGVSSQDGVQTGVLVDGGSAALGGGSGGSISVIGGQIDSGVSQSGDSGQAQASTLIIPTSKTLNINQANLTAQSVTKPTYLLYPQERVDYQIARIPLIIPIVLH